MSEISKSSGSASYPHLCRWTAEHGTVEIGHCGQTRSFIRVLDEGGIIWKGRRSYPTLDAALADAEAGVARWMRDELGITDVT
jgi:hypothetical protein